MKQVYLTEGHVAILIEGKAFSSQPKHKFICQGEKGENTPRHDAARTQERKHECLPRLASPRQAWRASSPSRLAQPAGQPPRSPEKIQKQKNQMIFEKSSKTIVLSANLGLHGPFLKSVTRFLDLRASKTSKTL